MPGDGSCPVAAARQVHPAFGPAAGPGPVYPITGGSGPGFFPPLTATAGEYSKAKVLWVIDSQRYGGPVLIRGARMDGADPVRFEEGQDEMFLPAGAAGAWAPGSDWPNWPSYTLARVKGCYAWQVDGQDFSYTIVFRG
ncbi:MAG TPA: hypothetical protein VF062_01995 [Candidatus Limnocylindrales bacterium]